MSSSNKKEERLIVRKDLIHVNPGASSLFM